MCLIVRAVMQEKWVHTSNYDKSMKLGTDVPYPKLLENFEGDTSKSHVNADISTFSFQYQVSKTAWIIYQWKGNFMLIIFS